MRPFTDYRDRTGIEWAGVSSWRRRLLVRAGLSPKLADVLAGDERTDVHALLELIDQGCPPELAARIFAPLEPEREWRH